MKNVNFVKVIMILLLSSIFFGCSSKEHESIHIGIVNQADVDSRYINNQIYNKNMLPSHTGQFFSPFTYIWDWIADKYSSWWDVNGWVRILLLSVVILILIITVLPAVVIVIICVLIGLVCAIFNFNPTYNTELDKIAIVTQNSKLSSGSYKDSSSVEIVIEKSESVFEALDKMASAYKVSVDNIYKLNKKIDKYYKNTNNIDSQKAKELREKVLYVLNKNSERLQKIAISMYQKTVQTEQFIYPIEKPLIEIHDLSKVNEAAAEAMGEKYSFNSTLIENNVVNVQQFGNEIEKILKESEKILKNPGLVTVSN